MRREVCHTAQLSLRFEQAASWPELSLKRDTLSVSSKSTVKEDTFDLSSREKREEGKARAHALFSFPPLREVMPKPSHESDTMRESVNHLHGLGTSRSRVVFCALIQPAILKDEEQNGTAAAEE
ncbi:uncharacterized protein UTRI_03295 [Ustilago trichophora]|uniref:Uncharacterized protein n=1 Tax=Ustilago trichophora TaxID=86804 RepID=A0A5C3E714_9BASI|nr:uncharacterized protein UTRI_03295 [Ustilago trichophora]